eukprot:scaffold1525_cov142-Cylindrotheca_fusiformis.AAC.48
MTANAGIIAHLRSGGGPTRLPDTQFPVGSSDNGGSSISAFLRQRSSTQSTSPPPHQARLATYKPTLEQLGLKAPFLPAGRVTQHSSIAWMDKSFLSNLRRMLRDVELAGGDAVSWEPTGDRFMIRDKTFFATNIAPQYFSIFSNSTFRLVAQSWGFDVETDPNTGFLTFHHPGFLRDDPSKCENLSMQEMKDFARIAEADATHKATSSSSSNNSTSDDPLLLLAATASSHHDATPTSSPQVTAKDGTKKHNNQKKSSLGPKKSSVIKARRASSLPLGAGRRSSANNNGLGNSYHGSGLNNNTNNNKSNNNGALSFASPRRSSFSPNTLTLRGSSSGSPSKPSLTLALLQSRRHRSATLPLETSVIAPFAGLHMSPSGSSPAAGRKVASSSKASIGVTFMMQNGSTMLTGGGGSGTSTNRVNNVSDHFRNRMR